MGMEQRTWCTNAVVGLVWELVMVSRVWGFPLVQYPESQLNTSTAEL